MKKLIVITSLALLPATVFSASPGDRFVIEAYGDSTTQGVTTPKGGRQTILKNNEISFLSAALQEKYGSRVEVVNRGIPSAEALELLRGTHGSKIPWEQQMKQSPAKLVLLNYAINDARHYHFNDMKGYVESPDDYKAIMIKLVTIARNNGKQVVLQEPNPLCGKAEKWNVDPYAIKLAEVASELSVPLVTQYNRIKTLDNWQSLMSADCIHPSESLYKNKAEQTFQLLDKGFGHQLAQYR